MQKRVQKKPPTGRVTDLNRPPRLQWRWAIPVFAFLIAAMAAVVFAHTLANGQHQASAGGSAVQAGNTYATLLTPVDTPDAQPTTHAGVFSLASGGPIPVPANVLHPTSIARVVVNNVLTSIYAGSMTRAPETGALAIFQENLVTGQESLHIYQTPQPVGALTILALHNNILTFSAAKIHGTFDLKTDQFQL
jgi:hypothetical protein